MHICIYLKKIYLENTYLWKICLVLVAAASPRPQEMFRAGNVRFWEKNDFQKMTLFFLNIIIIIFSKNHTRRSAIKFCVDPIFVGSELIGNRTSYDQNTFYIKHDISAVKNYISAVKNGISAVKIGISAVKMAFLP